jgi:hypothetical protein
MMSAATVVRKRGVAHPRSEELSVMLIEGLILFLNSLLCLRVDEPAENGPQDGTFS